MRPLHKSELPYRLCRQSIVGLRNAAQVLKAGDAVVAAARRPEQSPGLAKLKQQHGADLQLVKLDVNDVASLKVCHDGFRPVLPCSGSMKCTCPG